jgi:large-conductance mechanosensitive channel
MDQALKTFTSEGRDARKWIGRIIVAVILGEAIWSLIVSVMNNLVVPWLGDVMGQSSVLPTSFTQRPYDYPELFVSILEFCIAGAMAVILNYFFQRETAGRVKLVQSSVPTAPIEPARVVPQAEAAIAKIQATSPLAPIAPQAKPDAVIPPAPVPIAPAGPAPFVSLASLARPVAVAPPTPPIANSVATKPLAAAPRAEQPELKKPKEVYYNIVGEPVPSEDD